MSTDDTAYRCLWTSVSARNDIQPSKNESVLGEAGASDRLMISWLQISDGPPVPALVAPLKPARYLAEVTTGPVTGVPINDPS